jgi:hypothetical protein
MAMKNLLIIAYMSLGLLPIYAQNTDFSVTLKTNQSFVKLNQKQLVDSVNMNQKGPEQFEYFEIKLTEKELVEIDLFMENCRDIQSIINKFGRVEMDITIGSNSDLIQPISGFYYAVGYLKLINGQQLTLFVLYPRRDKMI